MDSGENTASDPHLLMVSAWFAALGHSNNVVAVDTEGALDRVWHRALIEIYMQLALTVHCCTRPERPCTKSKTSAQHAVSTGVPEGSSLGPLI